MPGILIALAVGGLLQESPTLGVELLKRNLPVPVDASDLEQPITSYSLLDDDRGFVIAYYRVEGDGRLHELRVRSFDARTRTWRTKQFPEPIGSVLSIQRHAGYLYVKGHSSPSATPLLVLSETLDRKRELDGWPVLLLEDGRVVFNRSMRHFAPTHAQVLAIYDPRTDRESSLYPHSVVENDRGAEHVPGRRDLWIDRSFSDVKKGEAPGTIEFLAVVQHMRLDERQAAQPAAPELRLTVTCDLSLPKPICRERPAAIGDSRLGIQD